MFAIFFNQSKDAPHQANLEKAKYKYHYRIDGKSEPIDGILVRDIFNRGSFADLELIPTVKKNTEARSPVKCLLNITIRNTSHIPAEKVCVIMNLSEEIITGGEHGPFIQVFKQNGQFNTDLIYPDLPSNLTTRDLKLLDFNEVDCHFQVVAKNMRKKESSFKIKKIGSEFIIFNKLP